MSGLVIIGLVVLVVVLAGAVWELWSANRDLRAEANKQLELIGTQAEAIDKLLAAAARASKRPGIVKLPKVGRS